MFVTNQLELLNYMILEHFQYCYLKLRKRQSLQVLTHEIYQHLEILFKVNLDTREVILQSRNRGRKEILSTMGNT
jgi:hypothetical protein